MTATLPQPDNDALAHSQALSRLIGEDIRSRGGWIPFAHFMQRALYTPQLGYYSGGAAKFGGGGDFVTAPTLTPLFGQTLARQINALLPQTAGTVYEFGAGNGALAAVLLQHLDQDALERYCIIEVSPELAARQQTLLAERLGTTLAAKVCHLQQLPETLDGIIIGNEVLDAMPVNLVQRHDGGWQEMGVVCGENGFAWAARSADAALAERAASLFPPDDGSDYRSELHLQQQAFIATLAQKLARGALLLIDYGFDAAQYYHPQRQQGTLIGHYRHHSVHDVFFYPGLTDLTAHVNFTAVADAGVAGGLDLIGYTTQAAFLLNLGITEALAACGPGDSPAYIREAAACQMLLAPHEMGELFKVMALGRAVSVDWAGFAHGDICHKL